ncbi:HEAT repeat domain-containing protein [Paenibacillus sp. MZ04-78.2]|uniref:HEAT repeat domain-containing protein n=1 Tax=Paenibacillus sp. MZ04-78.2 TaxID=2962034 RepID=UPI0020B729D9|nr:HEAT repeat domain-containing protein [Paenibacillus sp. MZ04-78.2]MCP3773885.1 HEAT repeat domain-containing protein [Paenibacillus sp. MZ04-78.2]
MKTLNKDRLIEDVRNVGYEITSIDDLMKIGTKDKNLLPLLLKYLTEVDDESDKQFLVRCLGVKGFKEAMPILLDEYEKSANQNLKWAIGNTISLIDDEGNLPKLMEVAGDKKNGMSRQMFIIAIGQTKNSIALPLLKSLLDDNEVVGHVIMALAKYQMPEIISDLQLLEQHPVKWVRNEAKKAIKKLSKLI